MKKKLLLSFILTLSLALCLSGCSDETVEKHSEISSFDEVEVARVTLSFDKDKAESSDDCYLDLTQIDKGYVGALTTKTNQKVVLQVVSYSDNGSMSYSYELTPNKPMFAPINMGDGHYSFSLMLNTVDNKYYTIMTVEKDVVLENDFSPYLIPTVYSDYNENSEAAQFAQSLVEGCANKGEAVERIYSWIASNINYDTAKASELANSIKWYVPNADEIFKSRKGICCDYSSLAAVMLRSIGIPTQVIMGDLNPGDLYHSWNNIYLNGQWITVKFEIKEDEWNRVDLTFAASRSDQSMLADDYDYTEHLRY